VLATDGGSRGNPGPAAIAYVLTAADGTLLAAHGVAGANGSLRPHRIGSHAPTASLRGATFGLARHPSPTEPNDDGGAPDPTERDTPPEERHVSLDQVASGLRAALYTRVSTDDQAREGQSLSEQERRGLDVVPEDVVHPGLLGG
jgi:hypothetical protein